MPGIGSLKQVLSKEFVIGLGGATSTAKSIAQAFSGGGSSPAAKVQLGLRRGAALYSNAVGRMNNVGGVLNISRGLLEELGEITDKMINLAERSTRRTTSNGQRASLDRDYRRLATEFQKLVEDAELDDKDILTKEGLAEFFTLVGLDHEKSDKLADVFAEFVVPDEEDVLASEEVTGGAVVLPAAIQPGEITGLYSYSKIQVSTSATSVSDGVISSSENVFIDDFDYINQNPSGNSSLVTIGENGNINALPEISSNVELKAVSENSGYSVFVSSEDFLGYNAGAADVLYLADDDGHVIHQYNGANIPDIGAFDVSEDGLTISFVSTADLTTENADGSAEVFVIRMTASDLGDDPTTISYTTRQITNQGADTPIDEMKMSESGDYVAFRLGSDPGNINIYNWDDDDVSTSGSSTDTRTIIGFSDNDEVAVFDETNLEVITGSYTVGLGNLTLTNAFDIGSGTELHAVSENGYLAYRAATRIWISDLHDGDTTDKNSVALLSGTDTISSLSVAANTGETVDVGLEITPIDTGINNLYRVRENVEKTTNVLSKPKSVEKIFDGDIRRREDAFRTLNDLEALREQIDGNIEAIDNALQYLQENVDLVRATGLAFLDLADTIATAEQAEDVARSLEKAIRRNASRAELAHSENLSPIAAATLVGLDDLE